MTAAPTIPFGRILRLGRKGTDVKGVKRALFRSAGKNDPSGLSPLFGPSMVRDVRAFQRKEGLEVDGVYGPLTHAELEPHFDSYAQLLYTGHPPPLPVALLQLPAVFTPTHQTAGLPGYPAIDVFAKPGTVVLAPMDGQVRRCSGHNPKDGGVPGGAYGWSLYLTVDHAELFITHMADRFVTEGTRVKRGDRIGTVCDAAVAHMDSKLSHIHLGKKAL